MLEDSVFFQSEETTMKSTLNQLSMSESCCGHWKIRMLPFLLK